MKQNVSRTNIVRSPYIGEDVMQYETGLISVIVPVYNAEQYLAQCLESIVHQTYAYLEIILINDGSSDRSGEICDSYAGKDQRIRVVHKENQGVSAARNDGLRMVTGDYIAFIDADDYILPEYFAYLYKLLKKYDADMSCCRCYKIWDSEKIPTFRDSLMEIVYSSTEAIEDMLYRKNLTGYPFLKLYKVSALKNKEFAVGVIYGEDMLFALQAFRQCDRIVYGERTLYIYYQHLTSATHGGNNAEQYKRTWRLTKRKIMEYVDRDNPTCIHAAQAKLFVTALDFCNRIWDISEAADFRRELLEYIRMVDGAVLKDKSCKRMNRVLGLLSCIDASMLVSMCRTFTWLKQYFQFNTRHSV